MDFSLIPGLSTEVRHKLCHARPATLGAAGRISGVTSAALVALLGYVRRQSPNPGRSKNVSRETMPVDKI